MLYETWTLAKTWQTRPSVLLRIEDEVAAYHLDRAVTVWGMALDADLDEAVNPPTKETKSAMVKARLVLDRWLREPAEDPNMVARAQAEAKAKGLSGFKDPAEMLRKKE